MFEKLYIFLNLFRWYENDEIVTRVHSKRYGITSINSSYDGTNISCDACNEAGCSIKSTKTLQMSR